MKYNDYEHLVYKYLKNYRSFGYQIRNLDTELNSIMEQTKELSYIKATQYDKPIVSGGEVTSSVERAYERREKLESRKYILMADKKRIISLIERINVSMGYLSEIDRQIVTMRYIDGCKWTKVALDTCYSERNCQGRARKAVCKIAALMFPKKADDKTADYVFVE